MWMNVFGWGIATFGLVGFIALMVLLGPAAVGAFFSTSLGRMVMMLGVLFVLGLGIRQWGYNSAHRECVAAEHKRAEEIASKDEQIKALSKEVDDRISREQESVEGKDDEVQKRLEEELAKRPGSASCPLSPDDIKRLR